MATDPPPTDVPATDPTALDPTGLDVPATDPTALDPTGLDVPATDPTGLDVHALDRRVRRVWDDEIEPALVDYIRVPALSVAFDPDWEAHGHLDAVAESAAEWARGRAIAGLRVEVVRLPGRTPVLVFEVPPFGPDDPIPTPTSADAHAHADDRNDGNTDARDRNDGNTDARDRNNGDTDAHDRSDGGADPDHGPDGGEADDGGDRAVLLYGHLDKQPPMEGWREGLGPWDPVVVDGRLYGRGGADDGYAAYASLAAIEAVQAEGGAHGRCIGLIECSEESGSPDLPAYVDHLASRIGTPDLVICLDSFCGDYEHLWATTSLRGLLSATLRVEVLHEGVHSGSASGVVPDSFRIARRLLDRIEDPGTGRILVPELWAEVPEGRRREVADIAADLGATLTSSYPYVDGAGPAIAPTDPAAQLLARTWEPTLTVIGADGLPPTGSAGNVLRPSTTLALSFRLPPSVDATAAGEAVIAALTVPAPPESRVTVEVDSAETGWDAPPTAAWLEEATDRASIATFGQPARRLGEGGSIPFMGMLGHRFPEAQFLLTGVLGPGSNAHGPNEFLDLRTARRLTTAVALVLDAHAHAHARPGPGPGPERAS